MDGRANPEFTQTMPYTQLNAGEVLIMTGHYKKYKQSIENNSIYSTMYENKNILPSSNVVSHTQQTCYIDPFGLINKIKKFDNQSFSIRYTLHKVRDETRRAVYMCV